jgi:aspartyl/asparaginyl beta-hydroxylase
MSTAAAAGAEARSAARFLNGYARQYAAGAFATPTASDMAGIIAAGGWHTSGDGLAGWTSRRLPRPSWRSDFTGARFELAAGWTVITHLAARPGAGIPDLDRYDRVFAYAEDGALTAQLRGQGREVAAVRISAASEVIAVWGRAGDGRRYPPAQAATLVQLAPPPAGLSWDAAAEAAALTGWHDDFPYYSDGSWDALSLRGFDPADPTWGVKPAEMSKAWHKAHPGHAGRDCAWTVLAERAPACVTLARHALHGAGLERVRLLRMAGRDGKGGRLARHCDITDRAAGVRDGQIARFHLPLITAPQVTMSAWNLRGEQTTAHLPAGSCWYLDARKPHAVVNGAGIDRIHLVVDVIADAATREFIAAGLDVAA